MSLRDCLFLIQCVIKVRFALVFWLKRPAYKCVVVFLRVKYKAMPVDQLTQLHLDCINQPETLMPVFSASVQCFLGFFLE